MSSIFQIYCEGAGEATPVGAYRSFSEAEAQRLHLVEFNAERRHLLRYWVEEIDTTGLFVVPERPVPRERYSARWTKVSPERSWTKLQVEVLEGDEVVATYARNHVMYDTFEPFRQGDRMLALVAPDYTATSVLDLATGEMLGGEEPRSDGFCPVGFYVPDWWDVWPEYLLPGSSLWKPHHEWPHGDFGFVWGCEWGDDGSWKVQFLDLSRAAEGVITRDDRFGYLELASRPGVPGSEFIRVSKYGSKTTVGFHVPCRFDMHTGHALDDEGNAVIRPL